MSSAAPFRPLVVGAPRSGFALLCSVVIHFVPFRPPKADVRQRLLNGAMDGLGPGISEVVAGEFTRAGLAQDLIYNQNFRLLQGGPKWLRAERPDLAAFRKYVGVRGMGDFTLVTSHPREVLDRDEVVHSHVEPGLWPRLPGYAGYTRFASVRHPVGILNSSVHSINALASEYIQRFVPPDQDDDRLRQQLALYKFTDLAFMDGLVRFLVGYLEDFVQHMHQYTLMRWEDLITQPVPTIEQLAAAAGIDLPAGFAASLWSRLDHVNLTGAHKHNYRAGKGIVGDWRHSITNEHLSLFRQRGLEPLSEALGYGPIVDLDERDYTPFQRTVSEAITRGAICDDVADRDLFTFAWNKSNILSDKFPFKRYAWRTWSQIERSTFADESLQMKVWDQAEQSLGDLNGLFGDLLAINRSVTADAKHDVDQIWKKHAGTVGAGNVERYEATRLALHAVCDGQTPVAMTAAPPTPRLVGEIGGYNVVQYRHEFFGLPQSLGEIRLEDDVELPTDVLRATSYRDVEAMIASRRLLERAGVQ